MKAPKFLRSLVVAREAEVPEVVNLVQNPTYGPPIFPLFPAGIITPPTLPTQAPTTKPPLLTASSPAPSWAAAI